MVERHNLIEKLNEYMASPVNFCLTDSEKFGQ